MNGGEAQDLFLAIDALLCEARAASRALGCRSYWETHNSITPDEIDMLTCLSRESLCAEAIASRLARDPASTQEFLDALETIGLVERCDERYKATPTAALYCWSLLENPTAD